MIPKQMAIGLARYHKKLSELRKKAAIKVGMSKTELAAYEKHLRGQNAKKVGAAKFSPPDKHSALMAAGVGADIKAAFLKEYDKLKADFKEQRRAEKSAGIKHKATLGETVKYAVKVGINKIRGK